MLQRGRAPGDRQHGGTFGDGPALRHQTVEVAVPAADRPQAHGSDEGQVARPVPELAQGQVDGRVGRVPLGVEADSHGLEVVVVGGPARQDAGDRACEVVLVQVAGDHPLRLGHPLRQVLPQRPRLYRVGQDVERGGGLAGVHPQRRLGVVRGRQRRSHHHRRAGPQTGARLPEPVQQRSEGLEHHQVRGVHMTHRQRRDAHVPWGRQGIRRTEAGCRERAVTGQPGGNPGGVQTGQVGVPAHDDQVLGVGDRVTASPVRGGGLRHAVGQDHVRVRSTEAERRHPDHTRSCPVRRPGRVLDRNSQMGAVPQQRVRVGDHGLTRDRSAFQGDQRVRDRHQARQHTGVPEDLLVRRQQARPLPRPQPGEQRAQFDLVAHRRAGAVRHDPVHVVGLDARVRPGPGYRQFLSARGRSVNALAPAVGGETGAPDDTEYRVAVGHGPRVRLEGEHDGALTDQRAVGRLVEGAHPAAHRDALGAAEEREPDRLDHRGPAGQRHVAGAFTQRLDRGVQGEQPTGAGRVEGQVLGTGGDKPA